MKVVDHLIPVLPAVPAVPQPGPVATSEGILASAPDEGAFRTDIATEAVENLEEDGLDVIGNGFERRTVELREGGE